MYENEKIMRITWVTRSFLDYRIPVFKALDELCGHQLTVIYYKDIPPVACQEKLKAVLGDRAIAREKELRIGNKPKIDNMSLSNTSFRIPVSPGLVKQVIETKPDVLVSDGFMQWTYAALAVRALKGIPHVMCYERTAYTERNASGLRKAYRRFVSRWIDAIDCNGSLTGEYVKSLLGWSDSRLTYGHMVADVEGLQKQVDTISEKEREELRIQLGIKETMLLYVGQLISRKGVEELLMAYSHIATEIPNMTLVMVGGGSLEEQLRMRIKEEKTPNVVLTGRIDYDKIVAYYKAADCFILPTTEDNWSLVVPEAMACGLPIATTIYNGCHPELVHPENGWVFDSLNQESIENTLLDIYAHKQHLTAMGKASERIVAGETAERAAQSIMDAIEIAVRRRK
mgnify:CR=1 FL=1